MNLMKVHWKGIFESDLSGFVKNSTLLFMKYIYYHIKPFRQEMYYLFCVTIRSNFPGKQYSPRHIFVKRGVMN